MRCLDDSRCRSTNSAESDFGDFVNDFDEDSIIYSFADEKNVTEYNVDELKDEEVRLIKTFESVINEEQPDIVMTYNGFGFDNKFLMTRVKQLLMEEQFGYISKMKKAKTELKINTCII